MGERRYNERALAVLTPISTQEARAFASAYALGGELRAVIGIPAGSVNSNFALELDRGRFFLRIYEEQDREGALAEAALLTRLEAAGVKATAPLANTHGAHVGELAGKPAAVFPWREGEMRCQKSVSAEDARRVGAALASVHVAGEGAGMRALTREGRFRFEDLRARLPRIAAAEDPVLAAQAEPLARKLDELGAERDASLPRGLIHGDLFRDNVLWATSGEISALLDFESASRGVYAYDVMVTVLAWCVGDALDVALFAAMVRGYESVRRLTDEERAALRTEGRAAALRFTLTRITDYAMRVTDGPRVVKDWRRFAMRLAAVEAISEADFARIVGVR